MEGHGLWQSSLLEIMEDFPKEEALGGGLSQCPEASLKNKHDRKKNNHDSNSCRYLSSACNMPISLC